MNQESGHQEAIQLFRKSTPIFQALGDTYRQDIIMVLSEHDSLSVNEITERSTLSRPAISHHLKILREVGLVSVEKKGTTRFYSLQLEDGVTTLKKLLDKVEETCF
ncbi:ArsR/SmtB family transcription factor [Guptibacillus hwajinpoensis]|uniref:DNA-binding transcriptional ArsR family regulator n=1 Tax=Guptibacillus hwajinpoensis TaxID=208199 RepID=A0ABU0K4C8_9BACL|nr:metalloregulator ArsR/SmtB family transcription factor [Alkalihalobacillus hemicentroti]MDQ0484216.1 DNA-binding transcriptional ArsR family regulator [Alkalihalobacillus hemicentroti]